MCPIVALNWSQLAVGRHGVISAQQAHRRPAPFVARIIKAGEDAVRLRLAARALGSLTAVNLAARQSNFEA